MEITLNLCGYHAEAARRWCLVLPQLQLEKFLEASEFLQNVVYINIQLTDDEKIERYTTLSHLYGQLGMQRKASFFRRVAAMQCVAPQNPRPAWQHCYHLLVQSLEGFKLSLDVRDIPRDRHYGWPIVQVRVLHELIYSARRMGKTNIVVRHLCLLLEVMFDSLSNQERAEMANVLESYTVKCEGTTKTISGDNGVLLPPVPLTKLPVIKSFKLQDAPPHLRPCKLARKKTKATAALNSSPFIYSPISMSSSRDQVEDRTKMTFQWVEGDICEVALQVYNPMPFELKVSNVGLLTSGVEFESYPISLALPAESGPFPAKIIGTAKDTGMLKVRGYTSLVLGVQNECLLSTLPTMKEEYYTIQVVPSLPQLQITTSLPKAASFTSMPDSASVVNSATANIYAGESCKCLVTLSNTGKETIEYLNPVLDSKVQPDLMSKVLSWNMSEIESQLPLEPNAIATFEVSIYGASDFLPLRQMDALFSPRSKAARWFSGEVASSDTEDASDAVILEVLLKIQYSGGLGYMDGYCRQCSVALTVEILPSLVFNKWDVVSEENSQQCHLVLDVENVTSHDINVTYSPNEQMMIEAAECKRVCVAMGRCEFPAFDEVPLEPRSRYMEGCQVTRNDLYAKHIAELVDIQWKMYGADNHGKVSIERLRWNPEQIATIRRPPFMWEVTVAGSPFTSAGPVTCHTGEPTTISCAITNHSNCDILDAKLCVHCFLDAETGGRYTELGGYVLVTGRDVSSSHKVTTQQSLVHEVTLTFLCTGTFKVEGVCTGLQRPIISQSESSIPSTPSQTAPAEPLQNSWRGGSLTFVVSD